MQTSNDCTSILRMLQKTSSLPLKENKNIRNMQLWIVWFFLEILLNGFIFFVCETPPHLNLRAPHEFYCETRQLQFNESFKHFIFWHWKPFFVFNLNHCSGHLSVTNPLLSFGFTQMWEVLMSWTSDSRGAMWFFVMTVTGRSSE